MKHIFLLLISLISHGLLAHGQTNHKIEELSKVLGYSIAKRLQNEKELYDFAVLTQAMRDCESKKSCIVDKEKEYELMEELQTEILKDKAKERNKKG